MRKQFGIFGVSEDGSLCHLFLDKEFLVEEAAEKFLEDNLEAYDGYTTYCILRILVS